MVCVHAFSPRGDAKVPESYTVGGVTHTERYNAVSE